MKSSLWLPCWYNIKDHFTFIWNRTFCSRFLLSMVKFIFLLVHRTWLKVYCRGKWKCAKTYTYIEIVIYSVDNFVTYQFFLLILLFFLCEFQKLYQQGARAFWIHNTGPIGCLPYFVINYPPKPNNSDQNGCIKSYNEVAQVFNKQLKDRIYQLTTKFQDASLIYVDIFNAKHSLISDAKEHGELIK